MEKVPSSRNMYKNSGVRDCAWRHCSMEWEEMVSSGEQEWTGTRVSL